MIAVYIALIVLFLVWGYTRLCYIFIAPKMPFWRFVNKNLAPGAKELVKTSDVIVKGYLVFAGIRVLYDIFITFW